MLRYALAALLGILTPLLVIGAPYKPSASDEQRLASIAQMPKLTLIIDDLGQSLRQDRRVLALPGPVAMAILPDTRHATTLAKQARTAGKTVMLHLPMAPAGGPYAWQPPLPEAELIGRLNSALQKVPGASGINNHMGSRFTTDRAGLDVVMAELSARGLLFLDSRTIPHSQAASVAGASVDIRSTLRRGCKRVPASMGTCSRPPSTRRPAPRSP